MRIARKEIGCSAGVLRIGIEELVCAARSGCATKTRAEGINGGWCVGTGRNDGDTILVI